MTNKQDIEAQSADQRDRLLQANKSLEESTRRLRESHRIALETEVIGASVISTLHHQHNQLVQVDENISRADENIETSSQILRTMTRREVINKMIGYVIAIAIVIVVIIIITILATR